MANKNTVSSDFYPRSSICKSIFDCPLSGVMKLLLLLSVCIMNLITWRYTPGRRCCMIKPSKYGPNNPG